MIRNLSKSRKASAIALLVSASFSLSAETTSPPEAAFCAGCHGEKGVSVNPMVPTLAGQPFTLIEDSLLAFRSGGRACTSERHDGSPQALLAQSMCAMVAGFEDPQIASLAEYFEQQDFVPADQGHEGDLVAAGARVHRESRCELCHSDGGRTTNAMAPVLAGQWTPYLRRALQALRDGSKKGPAEMNAAIRLLNDADVEALVNFYASQGGAD